MRVTFEFTLPDDAETFRIVNQAEGMYNVLTELAAYLRSQCKYHEPENRDDLPRVREKFYTLLTENQVVLE